MDNTARETMNETIKAINAAHAQAVKESGLNKRCKACWATLNAAQRAPGGNASFHHGLTCAACRKLQGTIDLNRFRFLWVALSTFQKTLDLTNRSQASLAKDFSSRLKSIEENAASVKSFSNQ
jgi:hypothetical protein